MADDRHEWFADTFYAGILRDVTFVAPAERMKCEPGQDSDGEAVGLMVACGDQDPEPRPQSHRTAQVFYDSRRKCFHEKDAPDAVLESCDELHLHADGAAHAYWLN